MANHRILAALTLVAVCVLSGCAAEAVAPSPSVAPPAAEATSTPSPEPPRSKVPFSGDCASVLPTDVAREIFLGAEPQVHAPNRPHGVMPDTSASLARLGGLMCWWTADDAQIGYLSVTMIPVGAVPESLVTAHAEFGCYGWAICGRAETRFGMWVLSETTRQYGPETELSESEAQALRSAVDAGIEAIFARSPEEVSGVPEEATEEWWTLPDCTALEQPVAAAAGMANPESGFPGDNIPEGPAWEVIEGEGVAAWCPWYEYSASGSTLITEIQMQSGVGGPSPAQLEAAGAVAISIPGADAAYRIDDGSGSGARAVEVLAIVGPNRIVVGGDRPEEVAAAALTVLMP
ncbi:hypothetical protein [Microbacterium yannicii]|uniref:hypothetical protein n=1 Tax=Microbacterium yannicii TaxID=671622 RepID=UPI0002EF26B3|nr:hypothetical protein [Microbacterium yannicii]